MRSGNLCFLEGSRARKGETETWWCHVLGPESLYAGAKHIGSPLPHSSSGSQNSLCICVLIHCSNLLVNSKGHLKFGWIIPYTASMAYCLKHSCLPAEGLSVAPRFCFALACADQMCRKWMISRAAFNHKRQKSVWNVLAFVWQGGETSMCVLYRQSHDGIVSLPCGTSLLTVPAVGVFFSL